MINSGTDKLPFRIANEIDKKYSETFNEARKKGVEVLVYQSEISNNEIIIKECIDF